MSHLSLKNSMCFAMVINAMKAVQGVEELLIPSTDLWVLIFLGMAAFPTSTQLILATSSTCNTLSVPHTLHFPKKGAGCGGDEQSSTEDVHSTEDVQVLESSLYLNMLSENTLSGGRLGDGHIYNRSEIAISFTSILFGCPWPSS